MQDFTVQAAAIDPALGRTMWAEGEECRQREK
jgi:hypothetical protein